MRSYTFNITWLHADGADPLRRRVEAGVTATTVLTAIGKFKEELYERGYEPRSIRIIDVQNMDIT